MSDRNVAGEACPGLLGQPMTAPWVIEGPATVEGADLASEAAFNTAFSHLRNRISVFTALPIAKIDRRAPRTRLRETGRLEGGTVPRTAIA